MWEEQFNVCDETDDEFGYCIEIWKNKNKHRRATTGSDWKFD